MCADRLFAKTFKLTKVLIYPTILTIKRQIFYKTIKIFLSNFNLYAN